jgi:hypothetical protein
VSEENKQEVDARPGAGCDIREETHLVSVTHCWIGCGNEIYRQLFRWSAVDSARTAHAQRMLVGMEPQFVAIEPPPFIEVEAPRISRGVPAVIE